MVGDDDGCFVLLMAGLYVEWLGNKVVVSVFCNADNLSADNCCCSC